MLKGHVFAKQTFGNPIFALFMDTFLNGRCGIADYKNNMKVTYNSYILTVSSGAACIRGRFVEEDNTTDIPVGTENGFCKLVIEVNLDNINTETDFTQASYKVLKNSARYPILTQTNIVKNNSGIYQFELAKFKVSSLGVTDFEDTRTYIDLENLYNDYNQKMQEIENNSNVVLKENFAIINFEMILNANTNENISKQPYKTNFTTKELNFPIGFNSENCTVLSFTTKKDNISIETGRFGWKNYPDSSDFLIGPLPHEIQLGKIIDGDLIEKIVIGVGNIATTSQKIICKLILMKI